MALKKIHVGELAPGMYVEALDRPWLETEYELEGVHVESSEDIARLRRYCEHVFITDAAGDRRNAAAPTAPPVNPNAGATGGARQRQSFPRS